MRLVTHSGLSWPATTFFPCDCSPSHRFAVGVGKPSAIAACVGRLVPPLPGLFAIA